MWGERGEVSTRQPAQDTSLLARQVEGESRAAGIMLLGPSLGEVCLPRPEQSAAPGAAGRAPGEDSRGETLACQLA